jgi:MOSC domain-containing protein YiiM
LWYLVAQLWQNEGVMREGRLVGIFVGPEAKVALTAAREVRAEAGRGLEGDRYWSRQGTFWKPKSDFEVTLIEIESLETLAAETGVVLEPRDARRNLATRGVRLNELVNREFQVGEVTLVGIRLCEPCGHLERLTGQKLKPFLEGRGGLRAGIVSSGMIRLGDPIREQSVKIRDENRESVDEAQFVICDL